jgi:hypothetical protein
MSKSPKSSQRKTRAAPRRRAAASRRIAKTAAPVRATDQIALLGPPAQASLNWMDVNTNVIESWLEWQRMLWQPFCDWQAAMAWRWYEVWAPSLIEPAVVRGEEQLA